MADSKSTDLLRELREQAELTQKHVAQNILHVRRRTFGDWETGTLKPQKNKQDVFRMYLLNDLRLIDDIEQFLEIWESIAVAEWDWDPIGLTDEWLLQRIRRGVNAAGNVPTIPPHLIRHELVGRESDQARVEQILSTENNCSIIGMAGVGKTALAVSIANSSYTVAQFKDGILWASLGQNPDAASALRQWAKILGRDISHISEIWLRAQAVRRAIGQRRMLLVIDDAWDEVSAQQMRCGGPNCGHLVTTRNQSVAQDFSLAEHVVQLSELSNEDSYTLLAKLAPDACGQHPSLAIPLAHQTGGLPLTIMLLGGYLAAPEARYFRANRESRLAELFDPENRLRLAQARLGSQANTMMSLQETIALSLESLPTDIVNLYYTFGSFAAKPAWFDAVAADAICSSESDTLALLVDRFLLEIGTNERLSIHQVLAEFARSHMEQDVVTRHRDYYLAYVMRDQSDWRSIETVYEQIRWAWDQETNHSSDTEILLSFITILAQYQQHRGHWVDRLDWCSTAAELSLAEQRHETFSAMLSETALAQYRMGDSIQAAELYGDTAKLNKMLGDLEGQVMAIQNAAMAMQSMGYLDQALETYQGALGLLGGSDFPETGATLLGNLGRLYDEMGAYEDGLDCLHQSAAIHHRLGNLEGEMNALLGLASVHIHMQDYGAAENTLRSIEEMNLIVGDRRIEATVYCEYGNMMAPLGELSGAMDRYQRSRQICQDIFDAAGEVKTLVGMGMTQYVIAQQANSLEEMWQALEFLYEAHTMQTEIHDRQALLHTYTAMGLASEWASAYDIALNHYTSAQELAEDMTNNLAAGLSLLRMGGVLFKMHEYEQAETVLSQALEKIVEAGSVMEERSVTISLVSVHKELGNTESALEHIERVIQIDHYLNLPEIDDDLHLRAELQTLI